ncbi:hypothetical protein B0H19DRAFT_984146, partial [Mycena capillaripes]
MGNVVSQFCPCRPSPSQGESTDNLPSHVDPQPSSPSQIPLPLSPSSEMAQVSASNGEESTRTRTIFALIIGIDNYLVEDFTPLKGAVNDARAFQQYLLDTYDENGLQVLSNNIILLENKQATRDVILSTFKSHFTDNKNIPDHGEAQMIFYFAGHGSRAEATGNHMAKDYKVETICPVDEGTKNAAGEYVHTIPDYIFGWLLKELAEKKGPNI